MTISGKISETSTRFGLTSKTLCNFFAGIRPNKGPMLHRLRKLPQSRPCRNPAANAFVAAVLKVTSFGRKLINLRVEYFIYCFIRLRSDHRHQKDYFASLHTLLVGLDKAKLKQLEKSRLWHPLCLKAGLGTYVLEVAAARGRDYQPLRSHIKSKKLRTVSLG